jgi:hypothetical protein
LSVDPGFCDLAGDDVTLAARSPLVTQTACGQIGAAGVGCAVTATTLTRLVVTPEGTGLAVRWGFGVSDATASWIERSVGEIGEWDSLGTGSRIGEREYIFVDRNVVSGQSYSYRVAWREGGRVERSAPATGVLSGSGTTSIVWPNPSRGGVEIEWSLASPGETAITVYDLAGREVATVVNGRFEAGPHRVRWDGSRSGGGMAPAGWYVVRIARGEARTDRTLMLIR